MPIRPELRHFYEGPAWEAIRAVILERAGGKCEQCGKPDRTRVATNGRGEWCLPTKNTWTGPDGRYVKPREGTTCHVIDVVLTVAHVDHNPANNDPGNLRAWCQRCHLAHDHPLHVRNAAETRRAKKNNQELDLWATEPRDP